jgi:hypothetical protein
MAPDHVVFGRRTDAFDESTASSSHALALTFRVRLEQVVPSVAKSKTIRATWNRLPWGFRTLRRSRKQAATNTGITSSGCATPSGFLNLLTLYSAYDPSRLVSCGWRPWASDLQRFSLSESGKRLATYLPFMLLLDAPPDPASRTARYAAAAPRVCAIGESVSTNTVLPDERRPILSWPCPSPRFSPLRPRPRASTKSPLLGFHVPLCGEPPIVTLALQSFKEPKGRLASFENCRPP